MRPYKRERGSGKATGFVGERKSSGMNEPWHLCRGERYAACEDDVGADISPPGEVLSRDGKYPKIPGPAGPDPERTFGK